MKKLISIVTPVLNEYENIDAYFSQMNPILEGLSDKYKFEFIFTDNRSTDNTYDKIRSLAESDHRIRVYRFSKNFGYQKSLLTGYSLALGDAAIEYDCDLQDPPELLPTFLEHYEAGHEIVYGIRRHRAEGPIVTFFRKVFYRLINKISESKIPVDAGDFMLLDRKVLDQLKSIYDHNIYLRGLIFSFGFRQKGIPYSRRARIMGQSKFPWRRMFGLAIDGILSQSLIPLRLAIYFGFVVSFLTLIGIIFYLFLKLSKGVEIQGFTTTVVLILFSIGLNGIFLGIIGEYLARIYLQVKKLPLVVIDQAFDGTRHGNQD